MNQRNSSVSLLPLQNVAYPTMSKFASRLSTFTADWPSYKCRATPEDFAVAGLFYIGTNDTVKCFYCARGLKNWWFVIKRISLSTIAVLKKKNFRGQVRIDLLIGTVNNHPYSVNLIVIEIYSQVTRIKL